MRRLFEGHDTDAERIAHEKRHKFFQHGLQLAKSISRKSDVEAVRLAKRRLLADPSEGEELVPNLGIEKGECSEYLTF
jgi:hypothetical protein